MHYTRGHIYSKLYSMLVECVKPGVFVASQCSLQINWRYFYKLIVVLENWLELSNVSVVDC